ncbi:MAG: hypothetical protein V1495_10835 [Pseudomonadota bacterium]
MTRLWLVVILLFSFVSTAPAQEGEPWSAERITKAVDQAVLPFEPKLAPGVYDATYLNAAINLWGSQLTRFKKVELEGEAKYGSGYEQFLQTQLRDRIIEKRKGGFGRFVAPPPPGGNEALRFAALNEFYMQLMYAVRFLPLEQGTPLLIELSETLKLSPEAKKLLIYFGEWVPFEAARQLTVYELLAAIGTPEAYAAIGKGLGKLLLFLPDQVSISTRVEELLIGEPDLVKKIAGIKEALALLAKEPEKTSADPTGLRRSESLARLNRILGDLRDLNSFSWRERVTRFFNLAENERLIIHRSHVGAEKGRLHFFSLTDPENRFGLVRSFYLEDVTPEKLTRVVKLAEAFRIPLGSYRVENSVLNDTEMMARWMAQSGKETTDLWTWLGMNGVPIERLRPPNEGDLFGATVAKRDLPMEVGKLRIEEEELRNQERLKGMAMAERSKLALRFAVEFRIVEIIKMVRR